MVTLGIIGAGYWGPNLVRNFATLPQCRLKVVCDQDRQALDRLRPHYPQLYFSLDWKEVLSWPEIQAVVIASPTSTHYEVALEALKKDKDVFVEKPLTSTVAEAEKLTAEAEKKGRILMVGHLMLFHPALARLKELIDQGELGEIFYLYFRRVNLGKIRKNENALLSFAPHDISMALYLLGKEPTEVWARGEAYVQPEVEDVVFLNMNFPGKVMAHIHVSWLDPHKRRELTVVGSKKMAVFNDISTTEPIRVYDKGVLEPGTYLSYGDSLGIRIGDIWIPKIDMQEPLRLQCLHFLECVEKRRQPLTNGRHGIRVVRVLEKAQESLKRKGVPVRLLD
ncbi:MAG: Gfo/Idh/MocA family protein [Candidatus Binatia bacterium]